MAKSPRKRASRGKKLSRRRKSSVGNFRLLAAVVVLLVIAIGGYLIFDDRHWQAFDDAGDGAFKRKNYKYAHSMYRKALLEAERLQDRQLIAETLADLQRVTHAQGRTAEAASFAARRAAIGR